MGAKYTTSKELQGLRKNARPEKALRAVIKQMKSLESKAKKSGFSIGFGVPYWQAGDGTGMSMDAGVYEAGKCLDRTSHDELDELVKVMEITTSCKELETLVLPVLLSKCDDKKKYTATYSGSISYLRERGPNFYCWGDPKRKKAGVYLKLSTYLQKDRDQKNFEDMLSGLCCPLEAS